MGTVTEMMPDSKSRRLRGTLQRLSRMPYMEDIVQQRNHVMNEQLELINIEHEMEHAAKKRTLTQKLDDFENVLARERECNELRSQLKTAEMERLKLKYYISEQNVARIKEYIEVSEILTTKNRRELSERESQLRQAEEGLLIACGQLRNLPHSDQEFSKHLPSLSEFMRGFDTRGKFKEALKIKDEEIAHLRHLFHGQKEEMEMKCTALGEKLLMQMKDRGSNMRARHENHDSIRGKFSDIKIQFRKELLEKEQRLKKELSTFDEDFSGELSEKHEHFREELSQKEEGFKRKVLQTIKKEISEKNKNIREERQEALSQRLDMAEEEIFESLQKELSESYDGIREMLFERKERFSKELSDRNHSFMKELSGRERTFKKEFSEKYNTVIELLSGLEMKHQKLMRSIKARDRSFNVGNKPKISFLLDLDPDVTENTAEREKKRKIWSVRWQRFISSIRGQPAKPKDR